MVLALGLTLWASQKAYEVRDILPILQIDNCGSQSEEILSLLSHKLT